MSKVKSHHKKIAAYIAAFLFCLFCVWVLLVFTVTPAPSGGGIFGPEEEKTLIEMHKSVPAGATH